MALRTGCVFVIPALRQHPTNHGHALVLPLAHTRNLADAAPGIRAEIFAVAAALTEAVARLYGAAGSTVFQNNVAPDDPEFHLHVHVVPRFPDDQFVMTRAAVAEVPRPERARQTAGMRPVLAPFARAAGRRHDG